MRYVISTRELSVRFLYWGNHKTGQIKGVFLAVVEETGKNIGMED
jgi:hypothetical protein